MKIVITGANGAVGQAILRCGSEHVLVAAVRSENAAKEIQPLLGPGKSSVRISYTDPAVLDDAFRDASAVIHLAGILIEAPGSA